MLLLNVMLYIELRGKNKRRLKMDKKQLPKVLIFEHPPIFKHGIGKTLYSFFYEWNRERLGQVYSVDLPVDENLCQYYYISETGKPTTNENKNRVKREAKRGSKLFGLMAAFAHSDFGVLIRNAKYNLMMRKNKGLETWIEEFAPECIFFGIGEIADENQYVLSLAKELRIPLIIYISDDYLTKWKNRKKFSGYVEKLSQTYVECMKYSSLVVVISDKMKQLYKKEFPDCNYLVASNSSVCKRHMLSHKKQVSNVISFSYTGNLGFGRGEMLTKFAKAIERYNSGNDTILTLSIYSQERPSEDLLSRFTNKYSTYKGNVVGEELDEERIKSDVLLLVESFDEQYKSILATALSTKVPEYLSYGKLIMAWAPHYAWSLDYLKKNEAAYCITNELVEPDLERFVELFKKSKLDKTITNGNVLFDERHEFFANANRFRKAVEDSINCFISENN